MFRKPVSPQRPGRSKTTCNAGSTRSAKSDAARFFVLGSNRVRYEIASRNQGSLEYRVGLWRQVWRDGKLLEFEPLEETLAHSAEPLFGDVTSTLFAQREIVRRTAAPRRPLLACPPRFGERHRRLRPERHRRRRHRQRRLGRNLRLPAGRPAQPLLQTPRRRHDGRHHRTRRSWPARQHRLRPVRRLPQQRPAGSGRAHRRRAALLSQPGRRNLPPQTRSLPLRKPAAGSLHRHVRRRLR